MQWALGVLLEYPYMDKISLLVNIAFDSHEYINHYLTSSDSAWRCCEEMDAVVSLI